MQETRVRYLGQEDLLEKRMATFVQYSYLENSMDRGEIYSPWGHKQLDRTEQLTHTHTHTHTQEAVRQRGYVLAKDSEL